MNKDDKILAILQDRQPDYLCDNCHARLFEEEVILNERYGIIWDVCPHCLYKFVTYIGNTNDHND